MLEQLLPLSVGASGSPHPAHLSMLWPTPGSPTTEPCAEEAQPCAPAAPLRKFPPPRLLPELPLLQSGLGGQVAHSEVGIARDFSRFRSVPTHTDT